MIDAPTPIDTYNDGARVSAFLVFRQIDAAGDFNASGLGGVPVGRACGAHAEGLFFLKRRRNPRRGEMARDREVSA